MHFFLNDSHETLDLAKDLAQAISSSGLSLPILFQGPLGAGKTTFVRGFVQTFPGGNQAEVSSPSFNLINVYPTKPEIVHIDLYRVSQTGIDDFLLEYLSCSESLTLVEWSENLPQLFWPKIYLKIILTDMGNGRQINLEPQGDPAVSIIELLSRQAAG